MSDKVTCDSDINPSDQRRNSMGSEPDKKCDIVSLLKELGWTAVFTHTSTGDSWKSNGVLIYDSIGSSDKYLNKVLQKN